jgi:DNA-binding GntR family transcriptional regulator
MRNLSVRGVCIDYIEMRIFMKNKRTCDYIAEAIQNEILSGRMKAGDALRQEDLAESLGYSRIPIREALQILEAQGLARRLATRHVVVADCSDQVLSEIFEMICQVEKKGIADLLEKDIAWNVSNKDHNTEETFHQFVYENISNEFFRRLLENASECYIRFAVNETGQGKQEEQQEKRNEYVRNIYNAYQKKDIQTIESALSRYYLLLAEYVREERSKTA